MRFKIYFDNDPDNAWPIQEFDSVWAMMNNLQEHQDLGEFDWGMPQHPYCLEWSPMEGCLGTFEAFHEASGGSVHIQQLDDEPTKWDVDEEPLSFLDQIAILRDMGRTPT